MGLENSIGIMKIWKLLMIYINLSIFIIYKNDTSIIKTIIRNINMSVTEFHSNFELDTCCTKKERSHFENRHSYCHTR